MIIGRVVSIKKLYNSFMGKSVKQRIFICIIAVVLLTFLFFIRQISLIFRLNRQRVQSRLTDRSSTSALLT